MSKQGSVDDRPLFRSGSGAAQFRDAGISADFSPWQASTRLPTSFIMANGRDEKGEIMTIDAVSDRGEFKVVQFNADGTYHYVERWLGRREALMLAWHCFRRQEGNSGPINRIIITDGGDFTVFEWKRGDGITFPPAEEQ
jgi:hypothetical protein